MKTVIATNGEPARFGTLDTLRGVAAVAVVLFHLALLQDTKGLLPHAYLAVDFFFILSGFVIAHSYEAKCRAGLSVRDFLVRRLIRLYPMVLVAVLLGAVVLGLKAHFDPSQVDSPIRIAGSTLANLFLVPNPFGTDVSQGLLFPGNPPLWSVMLEILVNLVWCVWLTRLRTRGLAIFVALCFAYAAWSILRSGSAHAGFNHATLPVGLARVGYGFGLGVLLYRTRDRLLGRRRVSFKILAAAILVAAFAMRSTGTTAAALWDLTCIALVIPLAMILGLNGADHLRLDRVLGGASYPLYAIHFPIVALFTGLGQVFPGLGKDFVLPVMTLALTVATIIAMKVIDEPARQWLIARWRRQRDRDSAPPLRDPEAALP